MIKQISAVCAALYLVAGAALAQSPPVRAPDAAAGSDWVAYRDAYRAMILLEKYGKPKQFLQHHYRVAPRDKATALDGVRLTINSKSMHLNLVLDALGRTAFPLSKAAYDDNAEISINRKAGLFEFGVWLSIVTRSDGVYEVADLRTACDQLLAYLRDINSRWGGAKKCVGVQFAYAQGEAAPDVKWRQAEHAPMALPVKDGPAYPGDAVNNFKVVALSFAPLPAGAQVLSRSMPLAITPLFE